MIDLNHMATFVRVVEHGSFTAAAAALGRPTSSVSRAVAQLEDELGVRLLHRTTRQLQLTDAGRDYHARARAAVASLDEAAKVAAEHGDAPRGTVRLTAPPMGGAPLLAELVAEFVSRHPAIRVELLLTSRHVDLVAEGVDLALRAGRLSDSSLVGRRLDWIEDQVVASPRYLAGRTALQTLEQLTAHPCVLYQGRNGKKTWRLSGPEGEQDVEVTGPIDADDLAFVHAATVAGAGIALLPSILAWPDIRQGTLLRLLPDHASKGAAMQLLWPSSSHLPARVALLRDYLAENLVSRCQERAGD